MFVTDLASFIRDVPNFPKPGILFRDITPLLENPEAFGELIEKLSLPFHNAVDGIVAVESRGFILGAAMARHLGVPLILARKPGKLPLEQVTRSYDLEYGSASLGVQVGSIKPEQRVLVVDDLLATGGTARAAGEIVEEMGGVVAAMVFAIELADLNGAFVLSPWPVHSVLVY
jgi:adenine phosphoribosyltransferase